MTHPILYSFRRCPYAMRARLAIASSAIQVELREIVLRDKAPEFLETSPTATVPCLKVKERIVDESLHIMVWALEQNDPENLMQMPPESYSLLSTCDGAFKQALDRYKYPNKFSDIDPIENKPFKEKVELLKKIDDYVRQKNPDIKQVTASFFGEHQSVEIIKSDNQVYKDQRPLVRFNVSVMMERNGKKETGSYGTGGRMDYENYLGSDNWKIICDEAIRQAEVNLESKPAPAGEMKVVLGPGWPGIILHEAIGHGLEGDFNRKKTSAFHNLVGQKIANENVTVVDDGTIASRRGSLTIDDEGTPTSRNILIENGILKNFMQDRMNAKLMKVEPTGNGRRESFEYAPMPRMTNTFMINGNHTQDEMIKSVDKGIYAVSFGGGQVDITNGKFVFSCTEAYEINNGKIGAPLKGVTLIGNGPDILTKVSMVGNDMKLDPGIGTCGKAGQWVPVGVGQPSILVDQITVGGTSI